MRWNKVARMWDCLCKHCPCSIYTQFVNHPSKIYSFAKATITRLNWIVWGNHSEKKRSSFECLLFFGVCFGILWQRLHELHKTFDFSHSYTMTFVHSSSLCINIISETCCEYRISIDVFIF